MELQKKLKNKFGYTKCIKIFFADIVYKITIFENCTTMNR